MESRKEKVFLLKSYLNKAVKEDLRGYIQASNQ